MRLSTQGFVAAALCAVSLLSFQPAHAQGQPTSPAISDQKLDATATAVARVNDLQKNYREKLQNTPPADQDRVADEANKAFEKAVTDQGLSLEEFSTILETAQQDLSVRERLAESACTRQHRRPFPSPLVGEGGAHAAKPHGRVRGDAPGTKTAMRAATARPTTIPLLHRQRVPLNSIQLTCHRGDECAAH